MTSAVSAVQLSFPVQGGRSRRRTSAPAAPMPMAVAGLLEQARRGVRQAAFATKPVDQFCGAYLAALRGAAAVVAARAQPRRHARPTSVWTLLRSVCPELAEWAEFFRSRSATRAAAEAGVTRLVSSRDGADLLRDAECFLSLVERALREPRAAA